MNKSTVRRIAALERAYEGQTDAAVQGVTLWQTLQPVPPLTIDEWTALAVPQQASLQKDIQP